MSLRRAWGPAPLIAVAVGVFLRDEGGRVLLQRRGDDGLWGEPGGALDEGEDFLTAARRELREETGLDCPNLRPFPLPEALQSGPELYGRYPHGDEIYVVGLRVEGELPAAALERARPDDSGETLELRWFDLDDLPEISSNANRASLSVLRARVGLPPLPLRPVPDPPPPGDYWKRLRRVAGARPLFLPGSTVLVEDDAGRVLLLRHAGSGRWVLPGGKLEPGESFEACARRELLEETGLGAAELEPVQVLSGPALRFSDASGPWDSVGVLYRACGVTGELRLPAGEITEARFVPAAELDGLPLLGEYTVRALDHWRAGRP